MTQTPQEFTKPYRMLTEWIAEKERYLSILVEGMGYQKKWSECDDPAKVEYYTPEYLLTKEKVETLQREIAECRHALKVHGREQRLKEAIEFYAPHMWTEMRAHFEVLLSTLYPNTPAPKEGE